MSKICFNSNIVLFVTFGVIIYLAFFHHKYESLIQELLNKRKRINKIERRNSRIERRPPPSIKMIENSNIRDPLVFPEERLDRHEYYLKNLPIYTRGYPDAPKLRGYLYEKKVGKENRRILPLFGYESYPNSRQFKYYTILNDVGLAYHLAPKIEIEYRIMNNRPFRLNRRELYDNDVVQMNELEKSRFIVKLLNKDELLF